MTQPLRCTHSGKTTLLLAAAAAMTGLGCGEVQWADVRVAPGYRSPTGPMLVTVVSNDLGDDRDEVEEAFTDVLRDRLEAYGIDATVDWRRSFVKRDSRARISNEAELEITDWDPGNRFLRWLFGWGSAGRGHIVVMVDMIDPQGDATMHGMVEGAVTWGFLGGSSMASATAAAKSIADAINRGAPR